LLKATLSMMSDRLGRPSGTYNKPFIAMLIERGACVPMRSFRL